MKMKKISNFLFTMFIVMVLISNGLSALTAKAAGNTLQPSSWSDWTLTDGDILDLSKIPDSSLDAGGKIINAVGVTNVTVKGVSSKIYNNLSIKISGGAEVTIEDLNITNTTGGNSPIIADDGNPNNKLIISGTNHMIGVLNNGYSIPGISISSGKTLIITSDSNTNMLYAKGGGIVAGIGGVANGGTISIGGSVNVTAAGGTGGAGIGGGMDGAGGTITIEGSGNVNATGGDNGAGIGGGMGGEGGTISIGGSVNVTATGGKDSAGIGGREVSITIKDSAKVFATGGENAAAIGGSRGILVVTFNIYNTPSITAIGKNARAIAAVYSTSLPVIEGKLQTVNSSTSTAISISGVNNSNTQNLTLREGYDYFASTVGNVGDYAISAGGATLIKNAAPYGPFTVTNSLNFFDNLQLGAKVSFDLQGGTAASAIQDQYMPINSKVSKPTDPTKDRYTFGGWYKEEACTTPWDFDTFTVAADTVLYAKWITPALINGLSFTDASGPENNGKTQINLGLPSKTDNVFKYSISSNDNPVAAPKVGDGTSGWISVANGDKIPTVNGKHIGVAEVDSEGKVVQFSDASAVVINESTTANLANNTVNLSSTAVTAGDTVTITAIGDRQRENGSIMGDERYIPTTWSSTETGKTGDFIFSEGNYTASYVTGIAGNYTVTANYIKQTWDGSKWISISPEVTDSKTKTIEVKEPIIVSVAAIPDVNVANGTAISAISLPSSVTVNLNNGTTTSAGITWNTSGASYNGSAAGTYTLTGTLMPPFGVINQDSKQASVNVIVAPAALASPANLTATVGVLKVGLSWNAVPAATSYKVYKRTTSGSGYELVSGNINTTSIEVNGLTAGTTYYFVVKATKEGMDSTNSNEVSAVPQADTEKPVIHLNGSSTVKLAYGATYTDQGATASDNVDGDITAGIVKAITSSSGTTASTINTSQPGTYTIHYNVRDAAENAADEVTRTVIVQIYVPPYVPPYIPPTPQPIIENRQAFIKVGKGEASVQVTVERITYPDGTKKDTIVFDENTTEKIIKEILQENTTFAAIYITDTSVKSADIMDIKFPKASSEKLPSNGGFLSLKTEKAAFYLTSETLAKLKGKDVEITISKEKDSSEIGNTKALMLKLVSGGQIISDTLKIEANYTGRTKITIPIDPIALPKEKEELNKFLNSLAVMVHHSDGEDVVDKGTIVYDEKGNVIGISLWVDKFSSFTLINIPAAYFQGKTTVMKDKVAADKQWQIKFTKPADVATVTKDNVYVVDSKGNKVEVKVNCGLDDVLNVMPVNPYTSGETYYLHITKAVKAKDKTPLVNELRYQFTVK